MGKFYFARKCVDGSLKSISIVNLKDFGFSKMCKSFRVEQV